MHRAIQMECTHPTCQPLSHQSTNLHGSTQLTEVKWSLYFKERTVVAEAITNKLSPPDDLPTSYASVSSFLQGSLLKQCNTLYSDLPYYAKEVCLPASGVIDKKT